MREALDRLSIRLEGRPSRLELRAIHLEMTTLAGQLQGKVHHAPRTMRVPDAEAALERYTSGLRAVGLDIRLASEASLQVGLRAALEDAYAALALIS